MSAKSQEFNINLSSEKATIALGTALAKTLRLGDFVALNGDLGAGKTTIARAIIRALMGENCEVPSPTFTLVQIYETTAFPIYHFDLYRIKSPDEIWELGWEDIGAGLVLCEWSERIGVNIPANRLEINLRFTAKGRFICLCPIGDANYKILLEERLKGVINEFI
jgi:tRNA threonylcarbamoyladenosine biosynthesis protein TsaE